MERQEKKSARLCILITPKAKRRLEEICAAADTSASQVVRQLVRLYTDSGGEILEARLRRK